MVEKLERLNLSALYDMVSVHYYEEIEARYKIGNWWETLILTGEKTEALIKELRDQFTFVTRNGVETYGPIRIEKTDYNEWTLQRSR